MEPKLEAQAEFPNLRLDIKEYIRNQNYIDNVNESSDSNVKKSIYLIPFDQIGKVPELLSELEWRYP